MGHVSGLFGVKGWVKVFSHTRPRSRIVEYKAWYLGRDSKPVTLQEGRSHKEGVVAKFEGIDDRDAAAVLLESEIWVDEAELSALPEDEYYWYQLIGLEVLDMNKQSLGSVTNLLETGANDVLVVRGEGKTEHLIPYIKGQVIQSIDLEKNCLIVDWDINF